MEAVEIKKEEAKGSSTSSIKMDILPQSEKSEFLEIKNEKVVKK